MSFNLVTGTSENGCNSAYGVSADWIDELKVFYARYSAELDIALTAAEAGETAKWANHKAEGGIARDYKAQTRAAWQAIFHASLVAQGLTPEQALRYERLKDTERSWM